MHLFYWGHLKSLVYGGSQSMILGASADVASERVRVNAFGNPLSVGVDCEMTLSAAATFLVVSFLTLNVDAFFCIIILLYVI